MTQARLTHDDFAPVALPRVATRMAFSWAGASLVMLLLLLSPALWNGFPLVFPDTGGYFTRPIEGTLAMGRSALYGLLIYMSMPLAFWPLVVAQAAAMAWVIVLALRCHGLGGRPWLAVAVVAALSLLTSLPWFAAQLMPDTLFPIAVLAIYLLTFRGAELKTPERWGLMALIAIAIAAHMAAFALVLGLVALLWLMSRFSWLSLPRPHLAFATGGAGAGVVLCLVSNLAITGALAFTPGGASFLFARLVEDGIAGRYLKEHCPEVQLRVCAYADVLPREADDWLWANDTPFYKLGGWEGFGPEAKHVIVESLRLYPWMHVRAAVTASLKQLASFKTEVSVRDNGPTDWTIREYAPQLFQTYKESRQSATPFDISAVNYLHVPVGAAALLALLALPLLRRKLQSAPDVVALCMTVLFALAINAVICGVFSQPVPRYQSRLMPLALLTVLIAVAPRRARPRLEKAPL